MGDYDLNKVHINQIISLIVSMGDIYEYIQDGRWLKTFLYFLAPSDPPFPVPSSPILFPLSTKIKILRLIRVLICKGRISPKMFEEKVGPQIRWSKKTKTIKFMGKWQQKYK